jgi:hypothetical protein
MDEVMGLPGWAVCIRSLSALGVPSSFMGRAS